MTSEDKKHYLLQYRNSVRRIREADEELEQLRLSTMYPSMPELDDMPHTHGASYDLSDYAVKVDELLARYKDELDRKLMIRSLIYDSAEGMGNEGLCLLIKYRYLHLIQTDDERRNQKDGSQLMSFEAIAVSMSYTYDYIIHMHATALDRIILPPELIRITGGKVCS